MLGTVIRQIPPAIRTPPMMKNIRVPMPPVVGSLKPFLLMMVVFSRSVVVASLSSLV